MVCPMRFVLVAVSAVIAIVALWQAKARESSNEQRPLKSEGQKQVRADVTLVQE